MTAHEGMLGSTDVYLRNSPTRFLDPEGHEAGVKFLPATIADFAKQLSDEQKKEFGKDTGIDFSSPADLAKRVFVNVREAQIEGVAFVLGSFINSVRFSCPKCEGTIIQVVTKKTTSTLKNGDTVDSPPQRFIESWVLDHDGTAKGLDTHAIFVFPLRKAIVEKMTQVVEMEVGCGLYKNQKLTGQTVPGIYDRINNGNPADVKWLGPTKKYRVSFELYHDGRWTLEDGATEVKQQGTFNQVK